MYQKFIEVSKDCYNTMPFNTCYEFDISVTQDLFIVFLSFFVYMGLGRIRLYGLSMYFVFGGQR